MQSESRLNLGGSNYPMSDVSLNRLRLLRDRAEAILDNVETDLRPFAKKDGTFRRKPDSPSIEGDTNVTTTCSCLMALALTNNVHKFSEGGTTAIAAAFQKLVEAPWMSSGLTANNAFTTTLVLRTFGFLEQEDVFSAPSGKIDWVNNEQAKLWELHFGIRDVLGLSRKLKGQVDLASTFLWLSLSDRTREQITSATETEGVTLEDADRLKRLTAALGLDLRRVIQGGWIYEESRFNKASEQAKAKLVQKPTGYLLAELNHLLLIDQFPDELTPKTGCSLKTIATLMAANPDNFSINEYPPSAAVMYWFVDGIARGQIGLPSQDWVVLCTWAAKEFNRQRSLVVADHDAMMDPIALGMASCLCAQLRAISDEARLGTSKDHLALLPSVVELERSVIELMAKQASSGIWPKYFPMFHYQDAGSNFCFTFELLEAVLCEFGRAANTLLNASQFIEGFEKAVAWCESNRMKCSHEAQEYEGWNSGGYLETLVKSQPESWATAVVHMFLWELTAVLSQRIQHTLLRKYKVQTPKARTAQVPSKEKSAVAGLLDIDVELQGQTERLSNILWTRIVNPYTGQDEMSLRRNPIKKKPLSVLLFGPPGTSKTRITQALAGDLNWPLVELTPSDFVRGTLANVYVQAEEIFDDLMDLSGVVVFFDEMDALVQTRDGNTHLDIASQFLTTTMLPKLTRLHDRGQVVFIMATNFQDRFDQAIKRAGRFDLLLCMGPPALSEKLSRLHKAYFLKSETAQTVKAGQLIKEYLKDDGQLEEQLGLYTFGEFRSFLKTIGDESEIDGKLQALGLSGFRDALTKYSRYVTLKLDDLQPLLKKFNRKSFAEVASETFTLSELQDGGITLSPIIRYLCDQKESKEQH